MQAHNRDLDYYIEKLNKRVDLSSKEAHEAMGMIMSEEAADSKKKDFLIALQAKGPTVEEIASFALTIRKLARQIDLAEVIKKKKVLVDTCGTGGGGVETFNVSTAIMFILSAAGLVVAKHGNRAITSKCGSADVLEQLGIDVKMQPEKASRCLSKIGIAFLFAPLYHGAFKNVQSVRRQITIPTVFNIIGPLVNPAFSSVGKQDVRMAQILGVNNLGLVRQMACVLKLLNLNRAMVVYGQDQPGKLGMDEISIIGDTYICELTESGQIKDYTINPKDFGIKLATPADLIGGGPEQNARILLNILQGEEKGAKRDIVLLNAAAGLYVGGVAKDIKEGIRVAADCIDSGKAFRKLELLRNFSRD